MKSAPFVESMELPSTAESLMRESKCLAKIKQKRGMVEKKKSNGSAIS